MKLRLMAAMATSLIIAMASGCSEEVTNTVTVRDTVETVVQKTDTIQTIKYDTTIVDGVPVITIDTVETIVKDTTILSNVIEKTLTEPVITDASIGKNEIVTLDASVVYTLDGFVFVEEGSELHIPAGTVIKGKAGQGADASALIICKGGKIFAEGTATNPIIFTAASDNLADATDLLPTDNGLWGGLIVLGKAPLNFITNDGASGSYGGAANIEGIPETEERGQYGGSDPADNSGIIKYVSIRHGGTNIGADNEINGLSLGAVGSGTEIDYIEIFANADDGIEFFGGTVQVKHAAVTYCGDDSFDYDESFRGKGQFWFTQKESGSDKAGEHDGGPSSNETGTPYAIPTIYNATYIGSGLTNATTGTDNVILRDNAGAHYANSIFANFYGSGVKVEDLETGMDSRAMLLNGDLTFKNNVFFYVGAKSGVAKTAVTDLIALAYEKWTPEDAYKVAAVAQLDSAVATWGNTIEDPVLGSYDIEVSVDPIPAADVVGTLATVPADGFFEAVAYKGAFKAGENWLKGWTALDSYGLLK